MKPAKVLGKLLLCSRSLLKRTINFIVPGSWNFCAVYYHLFLSLLSNYYNFQIKPANTKAEAEMSLSSFVARKSSSSSEDEWCDVDHVNKLSKKLKGSLFLNPEYSDVHLVVEGVSFPAHKMILATRSEYFRALLFGGLMESTQSKVELKTVTTAAFKPLLKYVYTGRLALKGLKLDVIGEILGLSDQWGFEELKAGICEYLDAELRLENLCAVLDIALSLGLESLVNACCVYADAIPALLMDHSSFLQLSPPGLKKIISRDSFFYSEEKIFEAACNWVRQNSEVHPDAASVLNHVRLPLMKLDLLLDDVRTSGLVPSDIIFEAISDQKRSRYTDLRHRGYLDSEVNLAHVRHGATVLKGEMPEAILDGKCNNYNASKGFTWHDINEDQDGGRARRGIVIKLRQQSIINHIKMLLWDKHKDFRSYSYFIEVSMDQKDWVRVCDRTRYNCRSWQTVFFPQRVVRYIRLVGTRSTVNTTKFSVVSVEASFTKKDLTIDPTFELLVPKENVARMTQGARVIKGLSRSYLCNGKTTGYNRHTGFSYHHPAPRNHILVQLAQPFVISSMRLLLLDCDEDRSYSYYIEVSTNQVNWVKVCDKSEENCKSWQVIRFDPIPVVYIRIVGTSSAADKTFKCVHLECPAQSE